MRTGRERQDSEETSETLRRIGLHVDPPFFPVDQVRDELRCDRGLGQPMMSMTESIDHPVIPPGCSDHRQREGIEGRNPIQRLESCSASKAGRKRFRRAMIADVRS